MYFLKSIILPYGFSYHGGLQNGALWTLPCEIAYYFCMPIIYKVSKSNKYQIISVFVFWIICWFDKSLSNYLLNGIANPVFFLYEYLIGCFMYKKICILKNILSKHFSFLLIVIFSLYYYVHDQIGCGVRVGEMHDIAIAPFIRFSTIVIAFSFGGVRLKKDITYSMYLFHMLIIGFMKEMGYSGKFIWIIVCFVVILATSIVINITIEKPLMKICSLERNVFKR